MSLLSAPQGWPERVWALINMLGAADGDLSQAEISGWLMPDFDDVQSAVMQTIDAARSLGLVRGSEKLTVSSTLADRDAFADAVHHQLAHADQENPDFVLFEMLAWVIVRNHRENATSWINAAKIANVCDLALKDLWPEDEGPRRFNDTKWQAWVRWIEFLGLAETFQNARLHVSLYARLCRTVTNLKHELGKGKSIPARKFLAAISSRMPYVDGGTIHASVAARLALGTPSYLSPALSDALRELHLDGVVRIDFPDDAPDPVRLAPDPFQPRPPFLHAVTILEASDAN
jgi:hypothetical protein